MPTDGTERDVSQRPVAPRARPHALMLTVELVICILCIFFSLSNNLSTGNIDNSQNKIKNFNLSRQALLLRPLHQINDT